MSVEQSTDERSITELRRMDESEAKGELNVYQYERWESVNQHLSEAEEIRQEWRDNEQEVTDILVNADMSSVASEVELFGNDVTAYYDPEDKRVREVAERLGDVLGVDIEAVEDIEASADDIDDDKLDDCKVALADFIGLTIETWDGHDWDDLSVADRESIKTQIAAPQPDGWGLSGLMDALSEIMVAVESARDDRLERVEKFRNPERRGDR